ncbi:MAG: YciI family protein [Paracoccaceae bacterium]
MRVMVIVKATADSESGRPPTTEEFTAMGAFNEELVKAGILVEADGLKASSHGRRVRFDGASRTVTDGPFPHPDELIAGFWIWNVANMDEAVEWVKRCPNPMRGPSTIEIRPFFEAADFGDSFTPDLQEREQRLRAEVDRQQGRK